MRAIDLGAVLTAALAGILLGCLWYSNILFGALWRQEAKVEQVAGYRALRVFGIGYVYSVLAAAVFAWLLGPDPALKAATVKGLLVGAGVAGASFGLNYQFAGRSLTLLLIDTGYLTAQFALFGMVLGLWP
jgi:hypothetical protein